MAQKLAALREQGVLIIGSGNIVHNLRAISWEHIDQIGAGYDWAFAFRETVNQAIATRDDETLVHYDQLGEKAKLGSLLAVAVHHGITRTARQYYVFQR